MDSTTHTGAHWRIDLPCDWARQPDNDGVACFQSADQNAGAYIAVWDIHSTDRDLTEVLHEFARGSIDTLDAMSGYTWAHRTVPLGEGDLLLESVDTNRHHRVLTRFIAQLPWVLRAAFHDYAFTTVPESNARLGPSLQAVWLA